MHFTLLFIGHLSLRFLSVYCNSTILQNCNHDRMVVDPGVNNTVEAPAKLSPAHKSSVNNVDLQSHLLHQSVVKDQPSGSNCTTSVSSMGNVDMEPHLLDQSPGTNNTTHASQLTNAAPAILLTDAEQPHQQNEVIDTETILHTPRTVGQQVQVLQGSISSLRLKRQKLFTGTPLSSKMASEEACSLGSEFVEHGKRISALKNALKTRLQESPAARRLPLVENNELGHQANDMLRNTEDHDSTLSVSSNSVPRHQLKKTGESFILGTPSREGLNEATRVMDASRHVLTLDSQPSHECNPLLDLDVGRKKTATENGHAVQERPEEIAKAARSPRKSRKVLSCVSQSSLMIEEKQNGALGNGQLVNVDWDKVKLQVYISKL